MINYDIPDSISQFQVKSSILDFNDLHFKPHGNNPNAVHGHLHLGNQFEISVIASLDGRRGVYGDLEQDLYEVAIYYKNEIVPVSPYGDVVGWQSPAQVSILMAKAQNEGSIWVDELIEDKEELRRDLGLDD